MCHHVPAPRELWGHTGRRLRAHLGLGMTSVASEDDSDPPGKAAGIWRVGEGRASLKAKGTKNMELHQLGMPKFCPTGLSAPQTSSGSSSSWPGRSWSSRIPGAAGSLHSSPGGLCDLSALESSELKRKKKRGFYD